MEESSELPRILAGRSKKLTIGKKLSTPQVYSVEEVGRVLGQAGERTRLYLLLMLNAGMYQGDISDLRDDEVDWTAGRIERKRSKTQRHDRVPVVRYKLWPDTARLLRKHRAKGGERVLLNQNGTPLVVHALTSDGRPRNADAIRNAFNRLRQKTGINKPLKLFRKTSATLVEGHERFRGLKHLFLGLSPLPQHLRA